MNENILKSITNPPIILGGTYVNSLGVVRDLGKIHVKSFVLHHNRFGIAGKSRFAEEIICPDPWEDQEALIDFLIQLGEKLNGKGIIFVTDDKYLEVVSKHRRDLLHYFSCTFPDYEYLGRMMDKNCQYQTAKELHIPYPKSEVINCGSDKTVFESFDYPFIIKGLEGKDFTRAVGKQVIKINSPIELRQYLSSGYQFPIVVQEEIPGADENLVTYGSFINHKGEIVSEFTGRKLLQFPPHFGTCMIGESIDVPEIRDYAKALLREFKFYGVSQVEFKYDSRDQAYKLIEINGRFWKWHSLAAECGVNISALAYWDITNQKKKFYLPNKQIYGKKWIVWIELIRYFLFTKNESLKKKVMNLKYVKPPIISALFKWKDPAPFFFYIYTLLAKTIHGKKAVEKIFK